LFAPAGFCANLTLESKRLAKFDNGTYPPVASRITLPKNIFEGNMNTTKYFQQPSKFLLNIVQEGDGLELLRDLKDEVTQLVIFDPQYQPFKGLT
ncbi:7103_t:CDS:2, partial [Funneliformis geosporum]